MVDGIQTTCPVCTPTTATAGQAAPKAAPTKRTPPLLAQVKRIRSFYVVNSILPICLNVWLALLVFAIDPNDISGRLGIVVTLFLSMTAIQFVASIYLV